MGSSPPGPRSGLQVSVLHRGRVVVDAVAGVADARTSEPVDPATLFFAASTGKGVVSSVVHVLVQDDPQACGAQGLLRWNGPTPCYLAV
ncbi:MAG: serine hydrolase [Actinobacteria bacterium]|nr:serine hydrolase [Actinomycetota bacterium]